MSNKFSPKAIFAYRKTWGCLFFIVVLAVVLYHALGVGEFIRYLKLTEMRNNLKAVSIGIHTYEKDHTKFPGAPRKVSMVCEEGVSWRVLLTPLMPGGKNVPKETPVFAIIWEDSPWTKQWSRNALGKDGNPVIVVHLGHHLEHTKWDSNCDLILKEDRVVLQGSDNTPIDLSGSIVLRLRGRTKYIPENSSFEEIVKILKGKKEDW